MYFMCTLVLDNSPQKQTFKLELLTVLFIVSVTISFTINLTTYEKYTPNPCKLTMKRDAFCKI